MPSFDIVSEVDEHELANAVDQTRRELDTRFDFRGVDASVELSDGNVVLAAPEDFQLAQMQDILRDKLTKRKIDPGVLEVGEAQGDGKVRKLSIAVRQGVDRDTSGKIVKLIKAQKSKVQAAIQGEKVRATGKKRDELQATMALLRDSDIELPLQFDNFRD